MILVAFGTRPEIIKLFPVINALRRREIPTQTLFTGQHLDLFHDVKELIPEPDFRFGEENNRRSTPETLGASFVRICSAAEKLFVAHRFDFVVVQGDTTTAWALAQMAFYNNIPVAHVEAGLRTFDLQNPYPEELNRTLITNVAELNFAPTEQATENLRQAGARNVHCVGNTIVDSVAHIQKTNGFMPEYSNKVLITIHRRENHRLLSNIFDGITTAANLHPELDFIFPIHPNPNVQAHRGRLTAPNIHVVAPVSYPEMLRLIATARFIISDSGGIQEEATCFNKKILIVREKTERPETVAVGLGRLVGKNILTHLEWALSPPSSNTRSPYGTGDSSARIAEILQSHRQ